MLAFLDGKKTYLVAGGFTLFAIFGWYTGLLTAEVAIGIINANGLGATIRNAIATDTKAVTAVAADVAAVKVVTDADLAAIVKMEK